MSPSGIALDLDWAGMQELVDDIAVRAARGGRPDVVVGILRGGAIPAVMLAHRLGVRDVRTVAAVRNRDEVPHSAKTSPVVSRAAGLGDLAGRDVLVVDDVVGSGETVDAVVDVVSAGRPARLRTAVAVLNTANWTRPGRDPLASFDHVGTVCTGWVRFPWETGGFT